MDVSSKLCLSGLIGKGDQIMMLEGKNMVDIKLEEAQGAFREEMSGPLDVSYYRVPYCD